MLDPHDTLLALHVIAGSLALVLGPVVLWVSRQGAFEGGAGTLYHWSVLAVCLTACGLVVLDPARLWWLLPPAGLSYALALLGFLAPRRRWRGWVSAYARGQGGSYVALVTALLVVALDGTASAAAWVLPTLVGHRLIERRVARLRARDGSERPSAGDERRLILEEGARPMDYSETWIRRGTHRIYARSYLGAGPPLILMHGFPDNLHLYARLLSHLRADRRVVTFDFLGWGRSDKPAGYPYTAANQMRDLDAVIDQLGLEQVVLVAHDASGPPAIDWALAHPQRIAALILLNTYYAWMPALRRPEAIFLYSTPVLRSLARFLVRRSDRLDRALYAWQVGRFIRDDDVRRAVVPVLYEQSRAARPAFWRLNSDLLGAVLSRRRKLSQLRSFRRPVRIIFGAADPYLNARVARRFHALFARSELFLVPQAQHYVQVDEPEKVARLILTAPTAAAAQSASEVLSRGRLAARTQPK